MIGVLFTSRLKEIEEGHGLSELRWKDFKGLLCNKLYIWLILLFLLINISATADQYTTVDKLLSLEASEVQIGFKWAIQSISEVPIFLMGDCLLKRFN